MQFKSHHHSPQAWRRWELVVSLVTPTDHCESGPAKALAMVCCIPSHSSSHFPSGVAGVVGAASNWIMAFASL